MYDAINKGNSILSDMYLSYANKGQWNIKDIECILKEINKVDDQILKVETNPLMLIMGCNTDILKDYYNKIIESLEGKIVIVNSKDTQEEIKNLIALLDETSTRIKTYIAELYKNKYIKLDI